MHLLAVLCLARGLLPSTQALPYINPKTSMIFLKPGIKCYITSLFCQTTTLSSCSSSTLYNSPMNFFALSLAESRLMRQFCRRSTSNVKINPFPEKNKTIYVNHRKLYHRYRWPFLQNTDQNTQLGHVLAVSELRYPFLHSCFFCLSFQTHLSLCTSLSELTTWLFTAGIDASKVHMEYSGIKMSFKLM